MLGNTLLQYRDRIVIPVPMLQERHEGGIWFQSDNVGAQIGSNPDSVTYVRSNVKVEIARAKELAVETL